MERHKTIRMSGYDYSSGGCYFMTVVTAGRRELFGRVEAGRMHLTEAGGMVAGCIMDVTAGFSGVSVANSVVMPNHVHVILCNAGGASMVEVMRRFKAVTSRLYRKGMYEKGWPAFDVRLWQRSYYDIIIRNSRMFDCVNNYIFVNPERWEYDKMNERHVEKPDEICMDACRLR